MLDPSRKVAPQSYLATIAGQFNTTVIGAGGISRGIKKRWPSRVTAYGRKLPGLRSVVKSRCGTVAAKSFLAAMPAAINVPSSDRKKSSLPSPRHRGDHPPSREILDSPDWIGNGRTYTSLRPDALTRTRSSGRRVRTLQRLPCAASQERRPACDRLRWAQSTSHCRWQT
jgi:hypothetical protein